MNTPDALDSLDADAALAGTVTSLDVDALQRLAAHPLDSIEQAYPHHAGAVDGGTGDRLAWSAERHLDAGLAGAFTDDYAGAHWLTSFVLYALTRNVD